MTVGENKKRRLRHCSLVAWSKKKKKKDTLVAAECKLIPRLTIMVSNLSPSKLQADFISLTFRGRVTPEFTGGPR